MSNEYVSAFQILCNVYDVKIDFATIEPIIDENGDISREERTVRSRIIMTPVLAKELVSMLSKVVNDYESKFGTITEVNQEQK